MREIFTHQDFTRVGHYKSILDSIGIPSFIRNGISHNSVTDMPSPVLFPTLCMENDSDYDRAVEVLREVYKPRDNQAPDWRCPSCKETIPGTFDSCWSCGTEAGAPAVVATAGEPVPAVVPSPDVAPAAPAKTEHHRAVTILRALLVVDLLFHIGFRFANSAMTIPGNVTGYLSFTEIYPENVMTRISIAYGPFAFPLTILALLLCFTLSRVGRAVYFITVLFMLVTELGSQVELWYRWSWPLADTARLVTGAVLAMLFFSPAAAYFQNKRE